MTYNETLDFLFAQLPMYQRVGKAAYKANLDTTLALDEYFGQPHNRFKTIHIAGTNGKGSVSHILTSVLMQAGYKVGLYTSPHLLDFRERIKIDGQKVSEDFVITFVEEHSEIIEKLSPSFFEITVAMAFKYFDKQEVDIAVIETGLGGRLDSTNIINPLISIITNIDYDHTQFLGNTLGKIAAEKAGIIKKNTPVIIGKTQDETQTVFRLKAEKLNSPIYFADQNYTCDYAFKTIEGKQSFNISKSGKLVFKDLQLDLLGSYQKENALTALQTIEILNSNKLLGKEISPEIIYKAFAEVSSKTGLLGRWQIIGNNPLTVCDTGHNEAGIKAITEQISQTPYKELHIVLGMVNDKNIDKVLKLLPLKAKYYFTKASIPRALEAEILKEKAGEFNLKGKVFNGVGEAYFSAKAAADERDFIFIGGSTFVVADLLLIINV